MRKVQKVFEKVYKSSDSITENILYLAFFKGLLQSFEKKKNVSEKNQFIKYYCKRLGIDY